ncbi:WGR domain-containing protein [Prosthecomicrobium hirschii]|uniref:WGR domain-containing protein n=1 Tax=Prosthecodimorpha hirschii TaxID=665126 RepID=UPI002220A451|nr:WGR domain-containing protein [Prosthecomicrobium hirschii]MCW1841755.1 WGR domain-containing protein [Prosthecomicrobium hirschii]
MPAVQLDLLEWLDGVTSPPVDRLCLRRVDPELNMHRFYVLGIERDLFGQWVLVREWGRIGRQGRVRANAYPSAAVAREARDQLADLKRRRGYRDLVEVPERRPFRWKGARPTQS